MPLIEIDRTRLAWTTVSEWCALAMREGSIVRPASAHYRRLDRLYRSLTADIIRQSHDVAGIARAAWMFDHARHHEVPHFHGLARTFSRSELGAMLVELRNRHDALVSGRWLLPRDKGPRFDPTRLTDEALDRLIQRHPDLRVVEQLRAERRARQIGDNGSEVSGPGSR